MSPYKVSRPTPPHTSFQSHFRINNYTLIQLQQELLATRRELETRSNRILSLEAALLARLELPADAPKSAKDQLIAEQSKIIRELEIVVRGYEDNLGEPLRAVREDVEKAWVDKFDVEVKLREEKEAWADELVKQLEKGKKVMFSLSLSRSFCPWDYMTRLHFRRCQNGICLPPDRPVPLTLTFHGYLPHRPSRR